MKNYLSIAFIVISVCVTGQTTTFDNLNANPLINKAITWTSSNYGSGFGHRIINTDPGGMTILNFQGRNNTAVWSDIMSMTSTGNIGIGTINPTSKLQIEGASTNLSIFKLRNTSWVCNQTTAIEFWNGGSRTAPTSRIVSKMDGCGLDGEAFLFDLQSAGETGPTTKLIIKNNGNVGIGTTTPDSKLTVKGKIHAEEVKVDLSVPGPDYVFAHDYDLPSLKELQKYISENKHLPNIPSAAEMEANGVELGVMNMKLLEKIEELTLYTLSQQKELEKKNKRINKVEAELKKQKEQLDKIEKLIKSSQTGK